MPLKIEAKAPGEAVTAGYDSPLFNGPASSKANARVWTILAVYER